MDILAYQKEAMAIIDNAFATNHLAHAYIFEGPMASGTIDAANYFASKLLCTSDNKPCGKCDNCLKVKEHIHSNVFIVEPIQNTIRKDQINSLIHEGHMSSVTSKERIYIIKDAHLMNRSSANTFLKTLEEPSDDNFFILLTDNLSALLETIVSRCQIIRFKPINTEQIEKLLNEKLNNKDYAYLLSELFLRFDEAIQFLNTHQALFDYIFKSFNDLVLGKDLYINYLFNKSQLMQDNNYKIYLDALLVFEKQMLKYQSSKINHFETYLNKIDKGTLDLNKIIKAIETISETKQKIESHVNIDLAFANMCIKLK